MRFEGIERVWMKLVDVDLKIAAWDRDYVELNPRSEKGIKIRVKDGKLSVDYKAIWKLGKTIKRDRSLEPLELHVPFGVPVSVGIKRGQVTAEGVHFESLSVGECKTSLKGCIIGDLISAVSTLSGSVVVKEKASVMAMAGTVALKVEELRGSIKAVSNMGILKICLPLDCDASISVENNGGVVKLDGIDPKDPVLGDGRDTITLRADIGGIVELTFCEGDEDDV
ncbi:hypothetical protein E3E36_08000 [Thermococcus sp. M36]|uniref:hypothetical protein n=1 Tax=Thermococcus sp. M36 TaxID=1638261 RepID=UPI00143AC4AD|nr:hypothetical protein [Thermococcus sp. M36]NJE06081.1 hypothetical protein [Thermococcus sp. M36]